MSTRSPPVPRSFLGCGYFPKKCKNHVLLGLSQNRNLLFWVAALPLAKFFPHYRFAQKATVMRFRPTQLLVVLSLISSGVVLSGCSGNSTAPKTPEAGAVQEFLDANPGYQEESDMEVASEEEEFAAGEE